MATLNRKPDPVYTHEGGTARRISPEFQLRRTLMACLLWERDFYESGESVAQRIENLVMQCDSTKVSVMMVEARSTMNLRHAPLLVASLLAKKGALSAPDLAAIIQRPDELCEFLAIYWRDGRSPLAAQVKKGLALAFTKFSAYQLAKYNRLDKAITLRDVLFLCHAKPKDQEQARLWKLLISNEIPTPDTWEVALTQAKTVDEKRGVWHRLLAEQKLGTLALLRNLRNMEKVDLDRGVIRNALSEMRTERVLPFRFIAAARYAPHLEPELEQAMLKSLETHEKLPGRTTLLIDVSGSMTWETTGKSELTRMDAACALAMLAREICEEVDVLTFSQQVVRVPPRRGFALRDAIVQSQPHGGTYLGQAVQAVNEQTKTDRLIVFTDEQTADRVPNPKGKGYMINVATNRNGVGYGPWTHIDGFSEACVRFIQEIEKARV